MCVPWKFLVFSEPIDRIWSPMLFQPSAQSMASFATCDLGCWRMTYPFFPIQRFHLLQDGCRPTSLPDSSVLAEACSFWIMTIGVSRTKSRVCPGPLALEGACGSELYCNTESQLWVHLMCCKQVQVVVCITGDCTPHVQVGL